MNMVPANQPTVRVLVVTHYFPEHGSGIEIAAHQLAKRLVDRGFALEWIASDNTGHASSGAPGALPERAWNITEQAFGIPYPVWSPFAFWRLSQAVGRCDVLHLHDTLYMGNVAAFVMARRVGKPVLVTQHIGLVPYRNPALAVTMEAANRLLAARLLRHSAATVVYSTTTQRYFSRLLPDSFRFVFISNGVDPASFYPVSTEKRENLRRELGWPTNRQVMLFVGRFVEKKGIDIIEALARRFPEQQWVMAGSGPRDPAAWNLPNVRCVGQCVHTDLARLYQAADLLVLPSVGEGFPLVVQESMACGTPAAVATETSVAHPGVAPMLWAAKPDVASFEALLRSIVSAPAVLQQRRVSVADFARREWSWEESADRYAELIRRIASGGSRQSATAPPM